MRATQWTLAVASVASAASLSDVCNTPYAKAALPASGNIPGITIDTSTVSATATYNASVTGNVMYPDTGLFDYCNVTFAYTHNGRNDRVLVTYWLPSPSKFQHRFLVTGGAGFAINSGNDSVAGGIPYGAVAGLTDGGFGGFDNEWNSVFLLANDTVNWEAVYMFGYQGIHEMTVIGKEFTTNFFKSNSTKLYTYYQGCSEGGREGMSQVQRFAETYDGAIIGAPAFRYSFQQANHLVTNIQEQTLGYAPPTCELERIVNATLEFCDPLDGKTDGVVSRTDLCALHFDLNTTVGLSYSCPAAAANPMKGLLTATPAQNGTVTQKGANLALTSLQGLKDSKGRQVYIPYQYGTNFIDGATAYDNSTGKWQISQSRYGGEWVERFLLLQNASALPSLEHITYDTLKDWMIYGYHTYASPLQATWPDLSSWNKAGNKILHYHGESDDSIPTASSVRYWESVRKYLYPQLSYNASAEALSKWYKLYSIPGAAHCSTNPNEPNGPWPQTNLAVMIEWVEKGIDPGHLNATHLLGARKGENAEAICAWPLRPSWRWNGTTRECVYDQESLDTWFYELDAVGFKVY